MDILNILRRVEAGSGLAYWQVIVSKYPKFAIYQRTGEHFGIVAVQSVFCRNAKCNLLITKVAKGCFCALRISASGD